MKTDENWLSQQRPIHGMTAEVSSETVQQLPTAPKMLVPVQGKPKKWMHLINLEL